MKDQHIAPDASQNDTTPPRAADIETNPIESNVPTVDRKRSRRQRRALWILLFLFLFAGLSAYGGYRLSDVFRQQGLSGVTPRSLVANDGNKVVTEAEASISGVVDKVAPSVVSIVTETQANSLRGVVTQAGAGTGMIVSANGYILTNKHVIEGADAVAVVLTDGTTYDNVKLVGTDPLNDIAFLKIEGVSDLPAVEIGSSSTLRVGQSVVAIGNSLGQYQNTVTSGIVSGVGRPVSAQSGDTVENLNDLIQTDAAINPGNSGGPLLNLQGQVIGINTAVAQDAQGVGFALPINAAKGILKGVLANGKVERAYIGVNYVTITPEVAKQYNLSVKSGAYVTSPEGAKPAIVAGSPADRAGIKEKDVITKVNGVDVGKAGDVASLVGEYAPGDTIELSVLRGGVAQTIRVTLVAYSA
jgi:serine protease Do